MTLRTDSRTPAPAAGGGIQVITRAGQILRALAGERYGLSLSEVAQRVGLPRSTVHRIVTSLESEGLVAAASPQGRYRLGPELIRLANRQHGELRMEVRPMLDQLAVRVNETVDLAVLLRDQVSFVDQITAPHRLGAVSAVGASFPAHSTANGKALLSTLSDATIAKLVPRRLEALTPRTITDRGALLDELARAREQGYALDREEHTTGISAIGATVRDAFGTVAAVSIPVPTQRFEGREEDLVDALLSTCARISRHLGAP